MSLEEAHRKLLAVDPARLPPACRNVMLARPVHALPLDGALQVKDWTGVDEIATQDFFPKLGIKSWRDGGSSCVIASGMPLRPVIESILANPTWQQRTLAGAWTDSGTPLHLYLYPFVDCTDVTESRWLAGPRGSRFVSACQRGRSGPLLGSALHAMQAFAGQVAQSIGEDVQLVELGLLPSGEIRLVEVNPALEPAEAAALLAG